MQISPITHAGYFAIIIAVHARGPISYDGEFRGYPSLEKSLVKYCPLNPESRAYFCNTYVATVGCASSPTDVCCTSTTLFYRDPDSYRDVTVMIIRIYNYVKCLNLFDYKIALADALEM